MPVLRTTVYGMFLVSGAAALVYEVLWVRQLSLVFGVSTYAIATVLSAFMAGLALGSHLFGRIALRVRRVVLLYGLLEIGIGVFGFLLPYAFDGLRRLYAGSFDELRAHPVAFVTLRAVAAALVLLVPTTLMGGTVSVLAKFFQRGPATLSRDLGKLYALNTLGAVLGCLLAGFVFLPQWGLSRTTQAVVLVNLAVGGYAVLLQFFVPRTLPGSAAPSAEDSSAAETRAPGRAFARLAILVFAVSGFLSLGYQVLWTRTLVFYLHNSTYAFTTMLAVFLLGLSLGSLVLNGRIDRSHRPGLYLALAQGGIGVTTLVSLLLFAWIPFLVVRLLPMFPIHSFPRALALQAVQAFVIVFPPTFFMGLTFPAVTRIAVRDLRQVSATVGRLYAFNTCGCIFGSAVIGFLLLPRLGLQNSFLALVFGNLLLAGLVLVAAPRVGFFPKLAGLLVLAAVAVGQRPLLPDGLFPRAFAEDYAKLLFYRDGATDTVMVKALRDDESVRVIAFADGRGTAGTMTSPSNRFMGHLPMLLHSAPRQVLSICFGVGNTLSALAAHPSLEHVDCVELSPNVVAAADWFPTNEGVVHHPKVSIHEQDGRNWLLGHDARYDVIQLEPPEIHTDGVIDLYTVEFYRLCRKRLAEGGLLCQWLNVTMMSLDDQRQLIATFRSVFPQGMAWMLSRGLTHVLLVGGRGTPLISYRRICDAYADPVLGADLREKTCLPDPIHFLSNFKLGPYGLGRFLDGAKIVTDDHTVVDFRAPRSVDANYGLSNGFSGHKIACTLPGGVAETNAYYADKLGTMLGAVESPYPWIVDFDSAEEAEAVRRALEEEYARWREAKRAEIEVVRNAEVVWANT